MASREIEVTVTSAKDLKNVNWRHGRLKPYAVLWVDPKNKCTTRVDEEGDTCPYWDQTITIPLNAPIHESTLYIDIVHAAAADEVTKSLIGSAKLHLRDVLDDPDRSTRKLDLKRPSGRPQGKIDVRVSVLRDPYYAPPPPPSYGGSVNTPIHNVQPPPPPSYRNPYGYDQSYGQPQPSYGYGQSYGQPQAPAGYGYGQPTTYGQQVGVQPGYGGQDPYGQTVAGTKESKFGGMGTGLAVGAVAGVLGGLALAEGAEYVEDKIADDVAEKVEDDLDDEDGYDGDDF